MRRDPKTRAELHNMINNFYKGVCKIPEDFSALRVQIVIDGCQAIDTALNNLELIYRRTLMHAEELRKLEKGQTKI